MFFILPVLWFDWALRVALAWVSLPIAGRCWLGWAPSAGCATHTSGASAGVAGPAGAKQVSLSMWPLPAVSIGFFVAWSLRGGRLVIWGLAVSRVSVP